MCVSRESIYSKAQDSVLSACYKRIPFCAKTGDQDIGTLFQLAGEGLPRKEKKRIKRLRSCPANRKTALASYRLSPHFRAASCCSLRCQAEKRHLPHIPPTEEEVHSYSLPLLPLQTRTGLFWLRTARQLPVHPSNASLTELSAVWGQQWGSQRCPKQGCALGREKLKLPLGSAPAESCMDRQAGASWDRDHSYKPAQEQVHEDPQKQ